jgi:hypothetical protein
MNPIHAGDYCYGASLFSFRLFWRGLSLGHHLRHSLRRFHPLSPLYREYFGCARQSIRKRLIAMIQFGHCKLEAPQSPVNYYDVLCVSPEVSLSELKAAYHRALLRLTEVTSTCKLIEPVTLRFPLDICSVVEAAEPMKTSDMTYLVCTSYQ